jgi:hypothetical protein
MCTRSRDEQLDGPQGLRHGGSHEAAPPTVNVTAATDDSVTLTYLLDLTTSAWMSAVRHADDGDALLLCRLLLSEPITEEGCVLVRDLLSRYKDLGVSEEEPVRLAERLIEVDLKKSARRAR